MSSSVTQKRKVSLNDYELTTTLGTGKSKFYPVAKVPTASVINFTW